MGEIQMNINTPKPSLTNKKFLEVSEPFFKKVLTRRRRRILAELLIAFLFLVLAVLYVYQTDLRSGLRLVIGVKAGIPHENIFRLFIGKHSPQEVKATGIGDSREVCFLLPREAITDLRLNFGQQPGVVVIKRIVIRGLFRAYSFRGKRLQTLFYRKHGINSDYLKDSCYWLEIADSQHWLAPGPIFYQALDRLQRDKTFYYMLSLMCALLFYYLLHFFDFRCLRKLVLLKSRRNAAGVVLTVVFTLVIFFPLLDRLLTGSGESRLVEKREMALKQEFRWDTLLPYLNRFTSYYNDHFPFRGLLIYWNSFLKVKLFGVSPVAKVLLGREGWVFFDKPGSQPGTVEYYRSITLFSPGELEQWKNCLEQRFRWLAARGIHYLFVIAPNKNTIYPEFMPGYIRKVHQQSRMDQLLDYLARHSAVPFLDLRPALLAAKQRYPVYSRTDTHWNDFGAYIAYREIIRSLSLYFKEARPLPLSRFKIKTVNHLGGDLAIMLSLQDVVLREDMIMLEADPPLSARGRRLKNISRFVRQSVSRGQNAPLPKMLMVHDSFYNRLQPFLSEQFSRVLYIWDWDMNFYPEIIEREKPKLVIDEMAERFFMDKIPVNPPPRGGS
jgi:alginate O-acetyltransferase complex protein AlgJ